MVFNPLPAVFIVATRLMIGTTQTFVRMALWCCKSGFSVKKLLAGGQHIGGYDVFLYSSQV